MIFTKPQVINLVRWLLFLAFVFTGLYFLAWAFQSASYSVSADPGLSEMYKLKSLIHLPMSVLFFSTGILFFIALRPRDSIVVQH